MASAVFQLIVFGDFCVFASTNSFTSVSNFKECIYTQNKNLSIAVMNLGKLWDSIVIISLSHRSWGLNRCLCELYHFATNDFFFDIRDCSVLLTWDSPPGGLGLVVKSTISIIQIFSFVLYNHLKREDLSLCKAYRCLVINATVAMSKLPVMHVLHVWFDSMIMFNIIPPKKNPPAHFPFAFCLKFNSLFQLDWLIKLLFG